MIRVLRLLTPIVFLAAFHVALAQAPAAENAPSAPAPTPAPPLTEPAPPEPKKYRAFSSSLAAALADSMPKYNPPKPAARTPDEPEADLRDIDKPKNKIVRLPDYVVQEPKPPVFRERDIHTAKGLGAVAVRRYLSETDLALNAFRLPLFGLSNEARAMMYYAEDERLQTIADLKDTATTVGKSDPKEAEYIRRTTDETYMRSTGFGYQRK